MAENNTSRLYSTPLDTCASFISPSTLNLTEDSGYYSGFINTSTNRSCLSGQTYVDFVEYLGDKYHQEMILKKILQNLSDEDLHSCSLVSKLWRDIIVCIPSIKKRLHDYVKKIERNKENRKTNTPKKTNSQEVRCFSTLTPRHRLAQIQNIQESASSSSASPPSSKLNFRFEAYQREARKLKTGNKLYSCPKCKLPSHVDPTIKNTAVCTNSTCYYRFCITCQCEEHLFKSCDYITTPVLRERCDNIGTAKNKKRLKRLLL